MSSTGISTCVTCKRQLDAREQAFCRCSGCKGLSYCSQVCQQSDCESHKQVCKIIAPDDSAKAASVTHIGGTVKGVRLACSTELGGFWEVDIPADHSMFNGPILEVPGILGIPLVIRRVGTQSNNRADLDCRIATFLNVTYKDGLACPQWQSHVGTCLVARKDKKPLTDKHLEAVRMYVDKLMDFYSEDGPGGAQKHITKHHFEAWFENYKDNEARNGRSEWRDVRSLYEL